jgi:hypothetical protein
MGRSMVWSRGDRRKPEATSQKDQQQNLPLNKVVSAEMMSDDTMNQIISISSAALKKVPFQQNLPSRQPTKTGILGDRKGKERKEEEEQSAYMSNLCSAKFC